MIDAIMLSYAKDKIHYQMTQKAIDSVLYSGGEFNITVVETTQKKYQNCATINPNERFAFNKFLGYGYEKTTKPYLLFLNNDIEAKNNFSHGLIRGLEIYDSVSPMSPKIHRNLKEEYTEGFDIWKTFCGWAFMLKRETIERIGFKIFFPEFCEGWYSDNIVCDVLKKNSLKHALVKSSRLEHIGQRTLNSIPRQERDYYMQGQEEKYLQWKATL